MSETVSVRPEYAQLVDAIKAGATFADLIKAYHDVHPLDAEELALVDRARDTKHRDGELEIDTYTVVSGVDDPAGDYVLAWVWVSRE